MASPVTPQEISATVPSASADICTKIKLVFLQLPALLAEWFAWAFDSAGNPTQEFLSAVSPITPGFVQYYAGSDIPMGWLHANGQAVSRTTYAALFAAIGTTWGAGDGSTTFNVPNLDNRVTMGSSSTHTLGETGGEETHTLTIAEMPAHTHQIASNTFPALGSGAVDSKPDSSGPQVSGSRGGNGAHNNLSPYAVLTALIKY